MDIDLARTFLEIIRSGSFIATAERLHITQTAVTARVHNLEEQLGCRLFVRNRAGARLTDDGQRFVAYATQLVQTWEAARRDLPLSQSGGKLLTLGSEVSLCNPLMLAWAQRLRQGLASHAIRLEVASGEELQKKLDLGVLDAALVHQPEYWPSLQVEQLLEEKLIQVVQTQNPAPYLYVDWGRRFASSTTRRCPNAVARRCRSVSGRWPCNTWCSAAGVAISAPASCSAIWTREFSSGWNRRRSFPTRSIWSMPEPASRRP